MSGGHFFMNPCTFFLFFSPVPPKPTGSPVTTRRDVSTCTYVQVHACVHVCVCVYTVEPPYCGHHCMGQRKCVLFREVSLFQRLI